MGAVVSATRNEDHWTSWWPWADDLLASFIRYKERSARTDLRQQQEPTHEEEGKRRSFLIVEDRV
jgi:hypothetical protein